MPSEVERQLEHIVVCYASQESYLPYGKVVKELQEPFACAQQGVPSVVLTLSELPQFSTGCSEALLRLGTIATVALSNNAAGKICSHVLHNMWRIWHNKEIHQSYPRYDSLYQKSAV